jgi:hypothetical protein
MGGLTVTNLPYKPGETIVVSGRGGLKIRPRLKACPHAIEQNS